MERLDLRFCWKQPTRLWPVVNAFSNFVGFTDESERGWWAEAGEGRSPWNERNRSQAKEDQLFTNTVRLTQARPLTKIPGQSRILTDRRPTAFWRRHGWQHQKKKGEVRESKSKMSKKNLKALSRRSTISLGHGIMDYLTDTEKKAIKDRIGRAFMDTLKQAQSSWPFKSPHRNEPK